MPRPRKRTSLTCRPANLAVPAAVETFEPRVLLSAAPIAAASPSIDGVGNNVSHPEWGSTDSPLLRLTSPEYGSDDGPAGADRPGARAVSNGVVAQSGSILNDRYLTDYAWIWGQFVDHDIDLTEGAQPAEPFDVPVPTGDAWFDPAGTGTAMIGLGRSVYDHNADGVRQQLNQITAFIDGSMVYGSNPERAAALRSFTGGRLKVSDGDLLPFNAAGLPNAGGTADTLFLAGDVRVNENVALTTMQTLWVREHNRIADRIAADHPGLDDEEIFQQARAVVIAEIQHITYDEFLPALLGPDALSRYEGYDPAVNPGIVNEFSTAAFRFGHSLLSPELQLTGNDGSPTAAPLALRDAFFRPDIVTPELVDSLLVGASFQHAQELDVHIVDDVRNFLFGPPGAGGFDLASLNIQRGRDHGLADYNQVREELGLGRVTSFAEITSDPALQARLEAVYGTVDDIDLWIGGLAEDHLAGSSLGETFRTIIVDQFERLRDGDRFWYQNVFHGRQLREIERTTLTDVIERNTTAAGLQENVFFAREVLYHDLSGDAAPVQLVVTDAGVRLLDARGRVLESRPHAEVERVMLVGGDHTRDQVRVTVDTTANVLPGGIAFDAGGGRNDALTIDVRNHGRDDVSATDDGFQVNGIGITVSSVERARVEADRRDRVDVEDAPIETQVVTTGPQRHDDRSPDHPDRRQDDHYRYDRHSSRPAQFDLDALDDLFRRLFRH